MRAHFVILLPPKISAMAAVLAKKYSGRFPHWFAVDNRKLFPHITLFILEVDNNQEQNIKEIFGKALKKENPLLLQISRHSYYKIFGGGWTGLKIKKSNNLVRLRTKLLKALEHFDTTGKKLENFSPHITLTKFKKDQDGKTVTKGSRIPTTEFVADEAALCLSDRKYSQVYKIIKIFKFK